MRPTDKKDTFTFVADADSINPYAKKDLNDDGVIDEADHLSPPGELYTGPDIRTMQKALHQPCMVRRPFKNQWGKLVTAFAPIYDSDQKAVAILGVDIAADNILQTSLNTIRSLVVTD